MRPSKATVVQNALPNLIVLSSGTSPLAEITGTARLWKQKNSGANSAPTPEVVRKWAICGYKPYYKGQLVYRTVVLTSEVCRIPGMAQAWCSTFWKNVSGFYVLPLLLTRRESSLCSPVPACHMLSPTAMSPYLAGKRQATNHRVGWNGVLLQPYFSIP
jgi:hypothetical protein